MHFNRSLLNSLFREGVNWLLGKYIPWKSLLKQVKWTERCLMLFLALLSGSIFAAGLLNYLIVQDTTINRNYSSLTWADIYHSNYGELPKTVKPDTLFLLAIYVQIVKLFFSILILAAVVYIFKFRLALSLYSRRYVVEGWNFFRDHVMGAILRIAFIPFPTQTYRKMQSWNIPDNKCPISMEGMINSIFGKGEFPKADAQEPLVVTKRLSFMYHDDFSWDTWIHRILKRYFPERYTRHLISSNTLTKSQELDRKDPRILKGVSVSISLSKFTTILGCNGSSKSVFLKTIIHLIERYQGKVFWIGRDMKSISSKSFYKNVAYVDQSNIIHNDISVYDYVACGLFPSFKLFRFKYAKDDDRIIRSLQKMEMLHQRDRSMRSLSGGEKQRAVLARALSQNTDVIILDEPTTYLDINAQYKILNLLKKLQVEENKTIITVLHDIDQAKQFSDEIILMDEGQVYAYGATSEVINRKNMKKVFGVSWN